MTIETDALELNRIAHIAYKNPHQALDELNTLVTPVELSYLRVSVLEHCALLCRPARKPRSPNKI